MLPYFGLPSEAANPARCVRSGLTILELIVAIAVISILAALLLPALGAVRESARGVECVSHLRQIGVALQCYEGTHRCLTAGLQWDTSRSSAYGWGVPLLASLEQPALAARIDRGRRIDDPANADAATSLLEVFACPSDVSESSFALFAESVGVPGVDGTQQSREIPLAELPSANYFGVWGVSEPDEADEHQPAILGEGAFIDSRPVRLVEFERGLSNSLFVGERTMARLPSTWLGVDIRGEDAACRLLGNVATHPNCDECDECEFASRHPGGANFVWGDGRVTLVPETIDTGVYRETARRSSR